MDQLPYDDIPKLATIVRTTYVGAPEEQKKATELLYSMGAEPVRFVNSLMTIITSDAAPDDTAAFNLKRACCVLMPTILSLYEKQVAENKRVILATLLENMFSPKVIFTLKPNIQPALLLFYGTDSQGELRKEGLLFSKEKLLNGDLGEIYSALHVLISIVNCSKLAQETTANWFTHLLEGFVKSGSTVVNGIILEIQEIVKGADHKTKLTNIQTGLTVLKSWAELILQFTNLLGKSDSELTFQPQYLKLMMSQEHILEILSKILVLHLPTDKQVTGCLLSTSGVAKIDDGLNATKNLVIECFNTIIDFMQTYKNLPSDPTVNKFYAYIRTAGIKLVMDGVFRFCKTEVVDIEKLLDDHAYASLQNCLVECLKFLTKLTAQRELYTVFASQRNHLVMDVCLPLIRTAAVELIDFQEDPEQFVLLALDTCQKQDSENCKTQATQLLETMCAQIDGVLSYTVVMLLQLIDFSLVSNDLAAIPEKFPRLVDYQNCIFLTKTDSQIRVETCILVLANISYLIHPRLDLMEVLERVFGEYLPYFIGEKATRTSRISAMSNSLIQARLCLFLGFFLEHIFKAEEKKECYQAYLEFLVKRAGSLEEELVSVAEQANHSLCMLFDSTKGPAPRLAPYVGNIIAQLATYIKGVKSAQFFDLLLEIFKTYEENIKENNQELLFDILRLLVQRAEDEYIVVKNDNEVSKMTLTKIWHIIRGIAEIKDFVLRFQEQIEGYLTPLVAHLETDNDLPFEDDILAYMAVVIKIRKEVTPFFWIVFKLFPKIFEKNKGMFWHMFPPLNQLIIYGKEKLNQDPETVQILINMGIQGLTPTHEKANSANVSEAALILQLVIQYLNVPNQMWENILVAALAKLKTVEKGFLKARLGGIFLCAFLTNFQLTQAVLVNVNEAGYVVDGFINNVLDYETHPYDRKVLLMGLTHFFSQTEIDPSIAERLPRILGILVPLFKYVEMVEQIEISKAEAGKEDSDDEIFAHRASDPEFLKDFLKDDFNPTNRDLRTMDQQNLFANMSTMNLNSLLGIQNNLGQQEEHKGEEDDDEEFDPDELLVILTAEDEANKVLDRLETDFKKQDEFAYFRNVVLKLKETSQETLEQLYNTLPEHKKKFMKDILHSQRVLLDEVEGKSQARRIVKPRARKVATNITLNNNQ